MLDGFLRPGAWILRRLRTGGKYLVLAAVLLPVLAMSVVTQVGSSEDALQQTRLEQRGTRALDVLSGLAVGLARSHDDVVHDRASRPVTAFVASVDREPAVTGPELGPSWRQVRTVVLALEEGASAAPGDAQKRVDLALKAVVDLAERSATVFGLELDADPRVYHLQLIVSQQLPRLILAAARGHAVASTLAGTPDVRTRGLGVAYAGDLRTAVEDLEHEGADTVRAGGAGSTTLVEPLAVTIRAAKDVHEALAALVAQEPSLPASRGHVATHPEELLDAAELLRTRALAQLQGDLGSRADALADQRLRPLVTSGLALLVVAYLIVALYRTTARDLALVTSGLAAVTTGDRTPVPVLPGDDELAALSRHVGLAQGRVGELVEALAAQAQRFEALVQHSSDVTLVTDAAGVVGYVSPSVEWLLGIDPSGWEGRPLPALVAGRDRDAVRHAMERLTSSGDEGIAVTFSVADGAGNTRVLRSLCRNMLEHEAIRGLVWNTRDVTDEHELAEQLAHRAFHDELTSLPNRGLFYDRLEQALTRARRWGSRTAVLLVDLDQFKPVNDRLGHAAGDSLLVSSARRLVSGVAVGDTVARLGGDEFGVVLNDVRDEHAALATAESLCRSLRRPLDLGGTTVTPRASVGVVFVDPAAEPGVASDIDGVLALADTAMYAAKAEGGDRARRYGPELKLAQGATRLEIEDVLGDPAAIVPVFQPIIALTSGRLVGYEALARFPGRSHRRPDEWFRLAHRCGLGVELEMKALRAALTVPGRPRDTYLSVNVSPDVLGAPQLAATLPADLHGIVLEITEQSQIDDDVLAGRLEELRARGARLAMDDAGAGYSGLQRLMRMRPDMVKLDRALVSEVDVQADKAALVEGLSFFCRRTGATLCAEGIETEAELLALADLDVTCGQGFVIGRPGPPWEEPEPAAVHACRQAYDSAVNDSIAAHAAPGADRQLEHLSAQLSRVTDLDGLFGCLHLAAELLHADEVSVSAVDRTGRYIETIANNGRFGGDHFAVANFPATALVLAEQVLREICVDDQDDDAAERAQLVAEGFAGMLMAPLLSDGRSIGLIEVYTREARPWTRTEVRRVRLIAYALGSVLHRLLMRAGDDLAKRRAAVGGSDTVLTALPRPR